MLNVLVCMKVVPKPEEVRINPETKTIDRSKARSEINPADMSAIEMALQLKDKYRAHITLLSMGPPFAEKFLKIGLSMGCDDAVLLTDKALAGADTLATAYTLAKAIDKIGKQHIILCGEESSDGATAQVPPGIAEWLNIAHVTYASSIEVEFKKKKLIAHRELKNVEEDVTVPLPVVVSVLTAAKKPRFIDFDRKAFIEANYKVRILNAKDIDVNPQRIGFTGSPTIVSGLKQLKIRERKKIRVDGSTPDEKVEKVWTFIKENIFSE